MNKLGHMAGFHCTLNTLPLIPGNILYFLIMQLKSAMLARQPRVKPSEFKGLNSADYAIVIYNLDLLSYVVNFLTFQIGFKCFGKILNKQV